jgi:hypothetical protein
MENIFAVKGGYQSDSPFYMQPFVSQKLADDSSSPAMDFRIVANRLEEH